MRISLDDNLYSIWYENEAGDRFVPDLTGAMPPDPPAGYVYQHAQLTGRVDHDVLKIVQRAEVDACPHPEVRPDNGLIDGLKGRRCTHCGGYQCVPTDQEWPPIWDASGCISLGSMSSGFSGGLVLAMTRPTEAEVKLALERRTRTVKVEGLAPIVTADFVFVAGDEVTICGPEPKLYSIYDAMLIAARACEGCMNVLLWRYGCNDGYPEGSDEHKRVGTSCLFCRPVPTRHGHAGGVSIGGHIAGRAEA